MRGIDYRGIYLTKDECAAWQEAIEAAELTPVRYYGAHPMGNVVDCDYETADGHWCLENLANLEDVARRACCMASQWLGVEVVASPWRDSYAHVNYFRTPASRISMHYDTNTVTALVQLTRGGCTVFEHGRLDDRPGRVVIFNGHELLHKAVVLEPDRYTVSINLYRTDLPIERMGGIDEILGLGDPKPNGPLTEAEAHNGRDPDLP